LLLAKTIQLECKLFLDTWNQHFISYII